MPRKNTTRKQYRVLAIIWTMAAAAVAVAVVRRMPEFNLLLVCVLLLSLLTASNFWRCFRRAQDVDAPDFTESAPRFSGQPVLFNDDLPPVGSELFADDDAPLASDPNQDSEEKNHE